MSVLTDTFHYRRSIDPQPEFSVCECGEPTTGKCQHPGCDEPGCGSHKHRCEDCRKRCCGIHSDNSFGYTLCLADTTRELDAEGAA
jgi:hypothetical protein